MIGIRVSWKCSLCAAAASTQTLEMPGRKIWLDPPPGWRVIANTVYCTAHARDGERIAEAAKASGASGLYGRRAA